MQVLDHVGDILDRVWSFQITIPAEHNMFDDQFLV
jgi:hypothetical protein